MSNDTLCTFGQSSMDQTAFHLRCQDNGRLEDKEANCAGLCSRPVMISIEGLHLEGGEIFQYMSIQRLVCHRVPQGDEDNSSALRL